MLLTSFSKFMLKSGTWMCFLTNAEKIFRAQSSVQLVYWNCLTGVTITTSGFIVRPWQCCHCLKYCLCPQKKKKPWRIMVPIQAIPEGISFFNLLDTMPRADSESSLFIATSPQSFQVLSSSLCSLLFTGPPPVSFPLGCPDGEEIPGDPAWWHSSSNLRALTSTCGTENIQ